MVVLWVVKPLRLLSWLKFGSTRSKRRWTLCPFNEQTQDRKGQPTPVVVTIYEDKSMSFVIKGTPAKTLIKEALKIKKEGSGVPQKTRLVN